MILKSFGCSFIYGSDLPDDYDRKPNDPPSRLTWPALLANDLGFEHQSFARPGAGNLRILEKILSDDYTETSIAVVGWTWIDRFDYTVNSNDQDHRMDLVGNDVWKTVVPVDTNLYAKNYYRDLHSQYRDKLVSLIYIKSAINILKENNIPFIMTYIDDLLFETNWHTNNAIVELQNYVRPHMTKFENQTFLNWSKEKGFPISETLHPLEQAHQAAFELIKSYNLV